MATQELITGKIEIEFIKDKEPRFKFSGDIDMMGMFALPYQLSSAYQNHLNILGDELRRKVELKGIETDKQAALEKAKKLEATKEMEKV